MAENISEPTQKAAQQKRDEETSSGNDIVQAVVKAARGLTIYPPGSPFHERFLGELHRKLTAHLETYRTPRLEPDPVFHRLDDKRQTGRMHCIGLRAAHTAIVARGCVCANVGAPQAPGMLCGPLDRRRAPFVTRHDDAKRITASSCHSRKVRGDTRNQVLRRLTVGQNFVLGAANATLKARSERSDRRPLHERAA